MIVKHFVSKNRQNQLRSQIQTIFKLINNQKNQNAPKEQNSRFKKNDSLAQSILIEDRTLLPNLVLVQEDETKNTLKSLKYNQLLYLLVYKKVPIKIITNFIKKKILSNPEINQKWVHTLTQQNVFKDVIQILNKHISQQWKEESFLQNQTIEKQKNSKKQLQSKPEKIVSKQQMKEPVPADFSRRQILKKIKLFKSQMQECQGLINMASSKKNEEEASQLSKKYQNLSKKLNYWKQKYRLQKCEKTKTFDEQTNKNQQNKNNQDQTKNDSELIFKFVMKNKNIEEKISQLMKTINDITLEERRMKRLKSLQSKNQKIIKTLQTKSKNQNSIDSVCTLLCQSQAKNKGILKSFESSKQKQLEYMKKVFKYYILAQTKTNNVDLSNKKSIDSTFNDYKSHLNNKVSRSIDNNHYRYQNGQDIHEIQQMTLESFSKFIKDFQLSASNKSSFNIYSETGKILTANQLVKLFKEKSSNKRSIKYSEFEELFQLIYEKQCQKLGIEFQPKYFDCFLQKQIFSFDKINKILRINITKLNEEQKIKQIMKNYQNHEEKSTHKKSINYGEFKTSPMQIKQKNPSICLSEKQIQQVGVFGKNQNHLSSNKQIAPSFIQYRFLPVSHTGKFPEQIMQKINANKKSSDQVPCMNPEFRKPLIKRKGIFLKYNKSYAQPPTNIKTLLKSQATIILKQKVSKKSKNLEQLNFDHTFDRPISKRNKKILLTIIPIPRHELDNSEIYKNSLSSYSKRFKKKKMQKKVYTLESQSNQQNKQEGLNQTIQLKILTNLNKKSDEQLQLERIIGISEKSEDSDMQEYTNEDFQDSNNISSEQDDALQSRNINANQGNIKKYNQRIQKEDDEYLRKIGLNQYKKWSFHY